MREGGGGAGGHLRCKALVLDVLYDVVGEVDGEQVLVELERGVHNSDLAHRSTNYKRMKDNGGNFKIEILTYPSLIVIQPYYCSSGSA